ncbi:SDR family oxidoreductase [Streptomyces sp. NPDC006332]|uniref:SDR family oxidoreductase n=1 Tax=Streptomyces sp. NPDC006332 TaxID=3155456 RepID=UPI0033B04926
MTATYPTPTSADQLRNSPPQNITTDSHHHRHEAERAHEDIAEAAAFLASEAAGNITSVVLDVDGGISIGSSIR